MKKLFFSALAVFAALSMDAQTIQISNNTSCDVYITIYGMDPLTNTTQIDDCSFVVPAGGSVNTAIASLPWNTGQALTPPPPMMPALPPIVAQDLIVVATDDPRCSPPGATVANFGCGATGTQIITTSTSPLCNNVGCGQGVTLSVTKTDSGPQNNPPHPYAGQSWNTTITIN